jgi:Flp pilus assembly pilin Flp
MVGDFRHQQNHYPGDFTHTDGPLSHPVRGLILGKLVIQALGIGRSRMTGFFRVLWERDDAQDVAEYAVMLAVILAIAVATIRLVGSHAGNVFANVGSAIR